MKQKNHIVIAISNDPEPELESLIKGNLRKLKTFRRYTLYTENLATQKG
jgi:hypothetical protein